MKKRFTEEQIIKVLKEREAGLPVKELIRTYGISEQTYYSWKSKYGGMEVNEARRLRELERREPPVEADRRRPGARYQDTEGYQLKKLVKPAERRRAAEYAATEHQVSTARSCGLIGIERSSFYYRAKRRDDTRLREALREAAAIHRRWGYRFLMTVMRREGFTDNHKRVYRIYREEGLQVRQRKRKRTAKWRGEKPVVPDRINTRWSMDFVHDATSDGRKLRMLNIIDDCTRRCLRIEVDTSVSGERVARTLDQVVEVHGKPQSLLMDNGPEFTGKQLDEWAYRNNVRLQYIEPGKPIAERLMWKALTEH